MQSHAALLQRYSGQGAFTRLYLRVRVRLIDFEAIDRAVGKGRRILDLACGFGLVGNYLARKDLSRTVLGLDLDEARIRVANAAAESGAQFRVGDITRDLPRGYDTITLFDTLHYFDSTTQREILAACFDVLPSGGRLVLRDQINDRSWRAAWGFVHEWLMTRLKITLTRDSVPRLNFVDSAQLDVMLRSVGFSEIEAHPSTGWSPYIDTLFICERRADVD